MDWPARSPDLNSIEHAYDMLKKVFLHAKSNQQRSVSSNRCSLGNWLSFLIIKYDNIWIFEFLQRTTIGTAFLTLTTTVANYKRNACFSGTFSPLTWRCKSSYKNEIVSKTKPTSQQWQSRLRKAAESSRQKKPVYFEINVATVTRLTTQLISVNKKPLTRSTNLICKARKQNTPIIVNSSCLELDFFQNRRY